MAGSTQFSFAVKLKVGQEIVPLTSEIVSGDQSTSDGVENGFLFKLDLEPGQVVSVNLGDIVAWLKNLGFTDLENNPGFDTIKKAIPNAVSDGKFNNSTVIDISSFLINSTDKEKLFSISLDVHGSNPSTGLIDMPEALASWLKIKDLAIAFSATKKQETS